MVGGVIYQNPPPHAHDDTGPDAQRISRRTAATLFFLVWGSASLLIYMVFVPWFAGLLNIDPAIVILPTGAAGVLVLVCPPIIRRVRARSAGHR